MLKITRLPAGEPPIVRLRVDGRVLRHSAAELANACRDDVTTGAPILLDLGGVSFVDAVGAAAITALARRDVTVIGCSPFIGALLRSHREHRDRDGARAADAGLLEQWRRGDASAFERIVRRHGPCLLATVRRWLGAEDARVPAPRDRRRHETEGDEIVRQAFLTAAEDLATLAADVPLDVDLRRRVLTRLLARRGPSSSATDASITPLLPRFDESGHWAGGAPPLLPAAIAPDVVQRCLASLPEPFRTTLVLCDVEEIDPDEVGWLLGTPAAVVRQRLHEARQAFRAIVARTLAADASPNDAAKH